MAHPKIGNTRTFTDEFAETLGLSAQQVDTIDELTYLFLKEHTFSIDPNYDEKKAMFTYFLSIARELDKDQKIILKEIIKARKEKNTTSSFEAIRSKQIVDKYKTLNLSEDRFEKFRKKMDEVDILVRKIVDESILNKTSRKPHHKRFKEAANTVLKDFLSPEELSKFNKIEDDAYQLSFKTRIEVLQHGYSSTLNIDKKQAAQIFHYEEQEPIYDKNGQYYSDLEKLDLYRDFMKSILNKDQFTNYIPIWEQNKKVIKDGIIANNLRKEQEIIRLKNKKEFLQHTYLPVICEWRSEIETLLDNNLKQKITLFRIAYHKNIISKCKEHTAESIRYYQNLCPNNILQIQTEFQIRALIPDTNYLMETMDLFSDLSPKLRKTILSPPPAVEHIKKEFNQFQIDNYENNGGTYGGWIHMNRRLRDEKLENLAILSTLLLQPLISDNISHMTNMSNSFNR